MKIIDRTHDVLTDEVIDIERDATSAEIDFIAKVKAEAQAQADAIAAKSAEKAALLAKLGITEDEARLLLG
jgi:hypothetical protein